MVSVNTEKVKEFWQTHRQAIVVVGTALLLTIALLVVRAGTPFAAFETEGGNLSGNTVVKSDTVASGGKYVEFSSGDGSTGQYGLSGPVGPQPSITCPANAVNISPGTNIQNVVDSHGQNTVFCLEAGTHRRQFIQPKSGNTFIGEYGAILDGENTTTLVFSNPVADVTIKNLEIRNYAGSSTERVRLIQGQNRPGWIIENNEIHHSGGSTTTALKVFSNSVVRNNYIHHIGHYCMNGGAGENIIIENNEAAFCGTNGLDGKVGWHRSDGAVEKSWWGGQGGSKFVITTGMIVRNNYFHNNAGQGIWLDINNIDAVLEYNIARENAYAGLENEIGCAITIRNNLAENNGWGRTHSPNWMGNPGILISDSPDADVYGNVLRNNFQAIGTNQWDHPNRKSVDKCNPQTRNLNVHDNIIYHNGNGAAGLSASGEFNPEAYSAAWNNQFTNNTYCVDSSVRWRWENSWLTFTQWKNKFPTEKQGCPES